MKICICGGGNLGHVIAGFVAAQDQHEVCVLTRHPERWSHDIQIDAPDNTTYVGHLSGVFSDAKQAISDAQIIYICLPGYAIHDMLLQIKDYLMVPELTVRDYLRDPDTDDEDEREELQNAPGDAHLHRQSLLLPLAKICRRTSGSVLPILENAVSIA